ncbi:MAG: hypothetical protein IT376_10310 [Polyangiaceae bacterium]|nr:hypothetical protein [Polyangiaceae bacterium]
MANVLGKVTGSMNDPRGPDVLHRIGVPGEWLDEGSVIELELPRLLTCATCEGGGCGACDQSGAITLRGRKELTELVEVTLPRRAPTMSEAPRSSRRSVTLRIPERGGAPEAGSELPRGMLYLTVQEASEPSPTVARLGPPSSAQRPATSRPPTVALPVPPPSRAPSPPPAPMPPPSPTGEQLEPPGRRPAARASRATVIVALVVAAWIVALIAIRLLGWG